jgi:single-strand DNA-binding protein
MSNLRNSVRLMGHAGNDPEVKIINEKQKVARLSLATNESYRNSNGERVEQTQWHQLVFWNRQAELVEQYLEKGSELTVEGKLTSHSYVAKDGQKRYVTEVVVNEIIFGNKK